jgi:predicted nucleic acid-binding protein
MNGYLVDTNVLSEFKKSKPPDVHVKKWVASTETDLLHISVVILSEIRFGIELLAIGRRRQQLEQWLDQDLHVWFAGRILGIDEPIGDLWARITAKRQIQGIPLDILDGFLAAQPFETISHS